MAWQNIFDLGAVTLYWQDENGDLRDLVELAEGTISEVGGVVIAIDVRSQYDGLGFPNTDAVLAIVAVPQDSARGLPARISVPSISKPQAPGSSSVNTDVVTGTVTGVSFTATGDPVSLAATIEGGIVTSLTPNDDVAIGDLEAAGTVGIRLTSTDNLS